MHKPIRHVALSARHVLPAIYPWFDPGPLTGVGGHDENEPALFPGITEIDVE